VVVDGEARPHDPEALRPRPQRHPRRLLRRTRNACRGVARGRHRSRLGRSALAREGGRRRPARALRQGAAARQGSAPVGRHRRRRRRDGGLERESRAALRPARGGWEALRAIARLVAPSTHLGDDDVRLLARPAGGAVAVYESSFRSARGTYRTRLSAVDLGSSGRPATPQPIGRGELFVGVVASPAGDLVVCCREIARGFVIDGPPADPVGLFVRRAGSTAWTLLEQQLPSSVDVESIAAGPDAIALGTVDVENSGDAGTLGQPGVVRGPLGGPFAPLRPAFVKRANKSFGPVVGIDGAGRTLLAYQEKSEASAFSRSAPLYAATATPGSPFGATRTTLDRTRVDEPLVQRLGGGAIVAWDRGTTWGVALERAGRFRRVGSPAGGPGELGRDAVTNRALATAGDYAALAWEDPAGEIRASVARLVP
jgi:hypothetical protein